ncbi:C-C motif chemokine 4-like [Hemibagrus wyckioides]|uniref:C-C motif chemokine 4-like n=1 Tax=Hemibagrus wyckioides TaxID=337641 RepID=UPI00266DC166|nr:C-C motif chemokine 4-like [Hemibagrus wyckioides]
MKNLMARLFLMSLCSLHLVFSAPAGFDHKTPCCPGTTKMRLRVKNIVKHWRASSDCPIKAIVFETHNKEENINYRFCLDPTATWVKNYLNKQ